MAVHFNTTGELGQGVQRFGNFMLQQRIREYDRLIGHDGYGYGSIITYISNNYKCIKCRLFFG